MLILDRDDRPLAQTASLSPPEIQPHGALLVLDAACSTVLQASENLNDFTGVTPEVAIANGPKAVLGRSTLQRLQRVIQGNGDVGGTLRVKRKVGQLSFRFQLEASLQEEGVLLEVERVGTLNQRNLLADVNAWIRRLADANHVDALLACLTQGVKQLTGYERVVVCAFDAEGHGAVVSESVDHDVRPLLGMRFPSRDFPPDVRQRFDVLPLRYVPDIQAPGVSIIAGGEAAFLDLRHAAGGLRELSVEQRQYLKRMGVESVLTMAIRGDSGVWGLLVGQAGQAHHVVPEIRDAAMGLVQMATQRLFLLKARAEARYRQRVQDSRDLLASQHAGLLTPAELLVRHGDDWLALFRASGVALVSPGVQETRGEVPSHHQLALFRERLERGHQHGGPWYTDSASEDPLTKDLELGSACGVLAVPMLTAGNIRRWLMLFRAELRQSHTWAGMPETGKLAVEPSGSSRLLERHQVWREEVRGHSEEWERVERLAAMDLAEDLAVMESAEEISHLNARLQRKSERLKEANARLLELAHRDSLTGVANRYRIEQLMEEELAAADRYGRPLSVLLLDVDHFKHINDTQGHDLGDQALVALAEELTRTLRSCDYVGRWGGEEFIVLATSSDRVAGEGLARRLRERVEALEVPGLPHGLTVSIGVASWRKGDSRKGLVQRADEAMYQAKSAGRNRVRLAT
ncbi:sensor domain-containing diguanylate cyclase [Halomonas marinisediminis]|uniref:diguanylate cyclase n=1 Tax=Halomonas marinisediminis TaxID=2546095 RepID=A0ABY2D5K5_9GAMM|nr:sensor domain-containing diguanylate cyclase [Halomonas marinisediminis]TDB01971.1 sensor domain-containing diguanylate cyclase [Halomonas marinisediminis]